MSHNLVSEEGKAIFRKIVTVDQETMKMENKNIILPV
jgi:hypothetical protein